MQGDLNVLIQDNIGLVYKQLHKFNLVKDPEAESIGYEALWNAINNFDESKGNKLSTVATVYIYNALGSYVRSLNGKRKIETVSYHNTFLSAESDDNEFVDFFASDTDVEKDYIQNELCAKARDVFNQVYDSLTNERQKIILKMWDESDFTMTATDISKQVGVSQSYVSQVINNFKFKMKKKLEDMYYD